MGYSIYKPRPATARFNTEECEMLLDAVKTAMNGVWHGGIDLADPDDLILWAKWDKIRKRLERRIDTEAIKAK